MMALAPLLSAQLMYVGTYTNPESKAKGIYAYQFDSKTGKLAPLGLMAEGPDPTFLAVHPNGKYLYAINEINSFQGKKAGSVSAYAIDKASGKLTLLNQVASGATGPCHIAVDATGKAVMVANYAGGAFASFPVHADGKLGEAASVETLSGSGVDKQRQSEPHAHSVVLTKNNKFLLGGDLGTDKVMIYKLDSATAKITPNNPAFATVKPGSGQRHLAISPDQKRVWVLSEMASTVTTFEFDANTGTMKELDVVSTLPANFKGQTSTAEIEVDARGRHVYASNRGHDSIAVFDVDAKTGKLKFVEAVTTSGSTPRAFVIDPSGNFIIAGNQKTNNISVLRIDQTTGKLTPLKDKIELGAPVTFAFVK
jgi:6-phosphogluconolactonase